MGKVFLKRGGKILLGLIGLLVVVSLLTDPQRYTPAPVSDADRARAIAYLDQHFVAPPDWTWHQTNVPKGYIGYGISRPPKAEIARNITIVYIPGYTGQAELFGSFYQTWYDKGYRVAAIDLPGQGRSMHHADNPELPWTGDFGEYGRDIALALIKIREQTDGKIIVVAASFGSHIALRAVTDQVVPIDGMVAFAPALEVMTPGIDPNFAKALTSGATLLGFGRRYGLKQQRWTLNWLPDGAPSRCGTRQDRVHLLNAYFVLHPEYRVNGLTNEWIAGLEKSGKRLAAGKFSLGKEMPMRFIFSGNDSVVYNERSEILCADHLLNCAVQTIPDAQHCIIMEPDDRIEISMDWIDDFIQSIE